LGFVSNDFCFADFISGIMKKKTTLLYFLSASFSVFFVVVVVFLFVFVFVRFTLICIIATISLSRRM